MALKTSPLAPERFPEVANIAGLRLLARRSEERYKGRNDVLIAVLDEGSTSAAVFTRSLTPGAPVIWSRQVHQQAEGRGMVVTAGNANVCTGQQGLDNARQMAEAIGKLGGLGENQVYVSSTGVIGEQLKVQPILDSFPDSLDVPSDQQDWFAAASAIRTTDTYAKAASTVLQLEGKTVNLSGIAKGSGMIEPNMATMLSYLFTDAAIDADVLQSMLAAAVDKSFNNITVDSDTSTSDTCLLFATGQAGNATITDPTSAEGRAFYAALELVMIDLAQQVVRDGEGAQKFISIRVSGAKTDQAAKIIAKSVANSPLVKTAIAGEDANWGRIVMAVGKAGQEINFGALRVSIGQILIAEGDGPVKDYDESLVQAHIEGQEVDIDVDVGLKEAGEAVVWTCDLTHGYIEINADYRS
jgi:glutamate N-acetyltransferase/amino-acid N-acetyltransferase